MAHSQLISTFRLICLSMALSFLTLSCEGGGGGNGEGEYGLEERPSLAEFTFPEDTPLLTDYQSVPVFRNLKFQTLISLTSPRDGTDRIVVMEYGGKIFIFPNSDDVTEAKVFLDLSALDTMMVGAAGTKGITFDPDYVNNGYFYVSYHSEDTDSHLFARFKVSDSDPDVADPDSLTVLFEIPRVRPNLHPGGDLAFGPDGMLYVALGDGGPLGDTNNRAQDKTVLRGSILRIDPHGGSPYAIPADNPFVGEGGGVREEIWAYGFRHPWRMSFDRETGDLWTGDVGNDLVEEVDIVVKGGNYGWRIYEGSTEFNNPLNEPLSAFESPIHEYAHHTGLGRSVIGGYVYRGSRLAGLVGKYIYGDHESGRIWALDVDGDTVVSNEEIANVSLVTSFGEDESGDVYAINLRGQIYRLHVAPPGRAYDEVVPRKLSQTGLFTDVETLTPASGLIEYEVTVPLWSDNSLKRRWIGVPDGEQIEFRETGPWKFPFGTTLVKHFELELSSGETTRLETRAFIFHPLGWMGYTYKWNEAQTDADLVLESETETYRVWSQTAGGVELSQEWLFPGPADCFRCHRAEAGRILGVKTQQINRDFDFPAKTDNQLRTWNHIGMFTEPLEDHEAYQAFPLLFGDDEAESTDSEALEELTATKARAYLDANCSHCHRPQSIVARRMDLRFETSRDEMGAIDAEPRQGTLDLFDPRIIKPGVKESSVLWERMRRSQPMRMPAIASSVVDNFAVDLVGAWIDQGAREPVRE